MADSRPPPYSNEASGSHESMEHRPQLKRPPGGISPELEEEEEEEEESARKRSKMATTLQEQEASFEELVTCPICMERMSEAKHLQCQHAFCLQCLEDWVHQPDTPKDRICCPVCRKDTPIPSQVRNLPSDININRILDLLQGMKPVNQPHITCSTDDNVALYRCQTCREDLCTKCFQKHNENPSFAQHNVELLKRKCKSHPEMSVNFFCRTCRKIACMVCKERSHHGHQVRPLRDVAKFNKENISQLVRKVGKTLERNRLYGNQVGLESTLTAFDDVTEAVERHAEVGIGLINKWKQNLLKEVLRKKELAYEQASEYESQYAVGESILLYAESKLEEPDYEIVSEYLSLKTSLHQTMEDLQNTLKRPSIDTEKVAHFTPDPWPSTFGSLGTDTRPQPQSSTSGHVETCCANSSETLNQIAGASSSTMFYDAVGSPDLDLSSQKKVSDTSLPSTSTPHPSGWSTLYPRIDPNHSDMYLDPVDSQATTPDCDSAFDEMSPETGSPAGASAPPIEESHLFNTRTSQYMFDVLGANWEQADISFSKKIFAEEGLASSFAHAAVGFFTWVTGKKKDVLQCPIDISVDNNRGYLYMLNQETKEVSRYDFPSDLHMHLPQLVMNNRTATSIAVSPKDDTVAATSVVKINFQPRGYVPDFSIRDKSEIPTHAYYPYTVRTIQAISISKNDHWVVLDKKKCLVGIYIHEETRESGFIFRHLLTFGSEGHLPGQFNDPSNVCCDSLRNRIYVSDTGNDRIQAFDLSGAFMWQSGRKGCRVGEFDRPQGLCVDGAGNVIVSDSGNSRLVVLSWDSGKCRKLINTNTKVLDYISPCSVGIFSPEHNNTAYIIMAGLRGKGRMPLVSIIKYIKGN